jgi:putative ABC transport system permease protein
VTGASKTQPEFGMIGYLIPVAFVLAVVVVLAIMAPVQRKLALRNVLRRKNEAALVIAGSLLGTALITGSFITGDTLDSSIRASARQQLGPIDEMVAISDPQRADELEETLRSGNDARIDGIMSLVAIQGSVATTGDDVLAEPEAQIIEADFGEARAFGDNPVDTGISGDTPDEGEIVISEDLADTIRSQAGDELRVFLYGSQIELTVKRVLPRLGIAGFWLGLESKSANAFVAPGTIKEVMGGELPPGAAPPLTRVLVSNRGDIEDGASLTQPVTDVIEEAVGEDSSPRVETLKRDALAEAETQGAEFSELFLGIGAFAIVAGILLLINIFVMLSQERKGQLGMLRAVGLRRADLVRLFMFEGCIYSFIAAILGALLGIGVGWAIVTVAAPIFAGAEEFALELTFSLTLESIVVGFCLGMLITTLTILLTSVRISRINIIRAIRDLPEPDKQLTRTRTQVLGVVFALLNSAAFVAALSDPKAWLQAIICPPLAAFGVLPILSRLLPRRAAVMLVSAASLFWGIFGNAIVGNRFFETGDIFAFVIQGSLLTFSAVVLLSQTADLWEKLTRRIAARNLPIRLGLAYPIARRFRTGLTLGMYALVIFTMTFISTLSTVFGGQVETTTRSAAGGFDLLITSSTSNPPSEDQLESVEGVDEASTMVQGQALFQPQGFPQPEPWPLTGIEQDFVDIGPPELGERDLKRFKSDREVWDAVMEDPQLIIVADFFLQEGGGPPATVVKPGDTLMVIDPITGRSVERTVAGALADDYAFSGAYMSRESVDGVLGDLAVPSRFFVQETDATGSSSEVPAELQGRFLANGVEAESFQSIVEEFQAINLQFFKLMQGYLALGLLVGIAGLGVVMVRAVRERRREIGVLRSLGFLSHSVRRAFLFESAFTSIQGILIGAALALVTAQQLIETGEFGETAEFAIPWTQLTVLCVAALVASLFATAWPAQQASRIPPAVALRVAE